MTMPKQMDVKVTKPQNKHGKRKHPENITLFTDDC